MSPFKDSSQMVGSVGRRMVGASMGAAILLPVFRACSQAGWSAAFKGVDALFRDSRNPYLAGVVGWGGLATFGFVSALMGAGKPALSLAVFFMAVLMASTLYVLRERISRLKAVDSQLGQGFSGGAVFAALASIALFFGSLSYAGVNALTANQPELKAAFADMYLVIVGGFWIFAVLSFSVKHLLNVEAFHAEAHVALSSEGSAPMTKEEVGQVIAKKARISISSQFKAIAFSLVLTGIYAWISGIAYVF